MRATIFVLAAGLAISPPGIRAEDPPKAWMFAGVAKAPAYEVRAQVAGQLTRIAVREGDAVKEGDLLAEIDSRSYRLDLEAAKARLMVAEARLRVAEINVARTERMIKKQVIGQDELDLNRASKAEAEAALLVAKVEVERAALNLSWTRITAPASGLVSQIQSCAGSPVSADGPHILRVVTTDPLCVVFSVPETVLLQLRRDGLSEPGKLDVAIGSAIDEGFPHAARLDAIGPEVDPQTANVRFRATVPNPKGILSHGMSIRVRVAPRPK